VPRPTPIRSIDPDDPDPGLLEEAAQILRAGGLVAFATETVYGLGADATNPEAVARIFEAKGRPPSNPLIVHADRLRMARSCVTGWPAEASILARRFWPGPLTLVLPRSGLIPDVVTAGRETVGVRIPKPNSARELIRRAGRPVAAPSANRSTGLSPTRAQHVLKDLEGRVDLVLDSGPTAVGLESTVLDLTSDMPRVLRPGPIEPRQLRWALRDRRDRLHGRSSSVSTRPTASPSSPGQMAVHYRPRTPAVRVEPEQLGSFPWPARFALLVLGRDPAVIPPLPEAVSRFELTDPEQAAGALYATLHQWDELGLDLIAIVPPPDLPRWQAIRDRLQRAATAGPEPRS
jgi:L-threonylcarbamoyladenylate synthase